MLRRFIPSYTSTTITAIAVNSSAFRSCVLCTNACARAAAASAVAAAAPSPPTAIHSSVQDLMTTVEEYDQVTIAESFLHQRKNYPDASADRQFLRSLFCELEGCSPSPVTGKMPNTYFLTTRHWDELEKWKKLMEEKKKVPVPWEDFCELTGTNKENHFYNKTRRLFWLKPLDREFLSDLIFDVDKSVEEKFGDRL